MGGFECKICHWYEGVMVGPQTQRSRKANSSLENDWKEHKAINKRQARIRSLGIQGQSIPVHHV